MNPSRLKSRPLLIWCWAAILACSVTLGFAYFRLVVWPQQHFIEVVEDPASTDDEIRESIHRLIAWNPSHDGFVMLIELGDETSIPFLIRSLERIPEDQQKSGMIECTWGHCREALVAITGEDFGYDAEKWQDWCKSQPQKR